MAKGDGHRLLTQLVGMYARQRQANFAAASRRAADEQRLRMLTAPPSGLLGDGRIADLDDAGAAGLFDPGGLFLGAMGGRMLFFSGEGHMLTYARTGSGKGRDLILPNLAHCRDRSLIVVDVKDGENCYASHRHRRDTLGQPCIFLNPFGLLGLPDTRINPLKALVDIIVAGDEIDTQADEIAAVLVPPGKRPENDWPGAGARDMLALRAEYLARFDPEQCTLGGLWRFINAGVEAMEVAYQAMANCGVEGIAGRAELQAAVWRDAPKQFEAWRSEARRGIAPFEPGKSLERATSAHDFDFGALKTRPHTVYLIAPSERLEVIARWISLVVNHAIEAAARRAGPVRACFLLDEFPQLPPAPAVMKALRLYRGKGVQLWFFAQGRFSMEARWSPEAVKEFEDQAAMFNTTGVEDPSLMRDIERWSGNRTVVMHGANLSGGVVESAGGSRSEQRRAVLQSEDIRAIGEGRQIIRLAGRPRLFVCDRVPFYKVKPWADQLHDVRDLHSGSEKS